MTDLACVLYLEINIKSQRRRRFSPLGISVVPLERAIEELQTTDTEALVRDKALRAFDYLGEPLFVEHTGLYLDYLQGLPGGLTQIFWEDPGESLCRAFWGPR